MRYEFCTPVTLAYVPRLLVLYRSLAEVCPNFQLWAFCIDADSKALLDRMRLQALTTVAREQLERYDPYLRVVRPTRSEAEYCWTAKASMCLFLLERAQPEAVIYADADLMFFRDPAPLFDESLNYSVLVVPHRFPPGVGWEETHGVFNAGFIAFRRGDEAEAVLRWWRERCLEWCYRRVEDGRYCDQRYLDEWPRRFSGVHALGHPGGGLAPWNTVTHTLASSGGSLTVDDEPLIFFHYQSLRLYKGLAALRRIAVLSNTYRFTPDPVPLVWSIDRYRMADLEEELIWAPYVRRIGEAIADIRRLDPGFSAGFTGATGPEVARDFARRASSAVRRFGAATRRTLREGHR